MAHALKLKLKLLQKSKLKLISWGARTTVNQIQIDFKISTSIS